MSRGHPRLTLRVSDILLAQVAEMAQRRGVDHSALVRNALTASLQPRRARAGEAPHPAQQELATALLQTLDAATRAQLTEGMSRFQSSAVDLVCAIVRQWAATMKDPRVWRGWRP
jgi:hypothetical protein